MNLESSIVTITSSYSDEKFTVVCGNLSGWSYWLDKEGEYEWHYLTIHFINGDKYPISFRTKDECDQQISNLIEAVQQQKFYRI